ncbi:ribonuclease H-like domain-containing protein [Hypoxylon fragiforme]|uniref:ribonuclease H-like domain-containing protein n=1 Tax=Hypoxylon fragiforme TaxID=63214 RepID=UPI0020C65934|nr:ribonuclease H-like domain-containing protein [Hypoxylon fragiforme]KAI2603417.1 ribonuclease H-like domain-containing protein [Hypoxylon fragiforme]
MSHIRRVGSRLMEFWVDGGCRSSGISNAIGASASCLRVTKNRYEVKREELSNTDFPATNQRAELLAIFLALETALDKYKGKKKVSLNIHIHSDSAYAVGCMTEWLERWSLNGWKTAKNKDVANMDLIQAAAELDRRCQMMGHYTSYRQIPREKNNMADNVCKEALDIIEEEGRLTGPRTLRMRSN